MFSKRNAPGNAGLAEPEQLADDAAVATLSDETAGDAETPDAPDESTQTPWEELGFASATELVEQFQHLNSLRGRLANEVGELRAENEQLHQALEEGGGDAPAPNVVGLLEELDSRSLAQFESLARRVAETIELRVGPLEERVDALIDRLASATASRGGPDA